MELEVDDLSPSHASREPGRRPSVTSMSDLFLEAATDMDLQAKQKPSVSQEMSEDMKALFTSLESLAEAASSLILAGHVEEALELLERAFTSVEDQDEVALARVGVQILLCAGLSKAGRHVEALELAQNAVESADAVLEQLEELEQPEEEGEVLQVPLELAQRALELAVQARQCQAIEMEFLGPRQEEVGLDFWQKLLVLQDEGLELAQHLPRGSEVRRRAEQSKREWQSRAAEATLPKISPSSSTALQAWRCMLGVPRRMRSEQGLELPRHERLYQGLPPLVDLEYEKWRRNPSFLEPSTPSEKERGSLARTSSSWSTGSLGKPGQLPAGDLYVHTSPRRSELPKTPNWSSARRVPVLFSIQGTKGKSSWALRTVRKKRDRVVDDQKMNAFEDWRKNGSGPKMRLRDQVLQTEKGIQFFHNNLKKQSYRFKNFWLKEMVTGEDLYEDRTFYCSEGLRVLRKNPRGQPRPTSPTAPQVKKLFDHYGITCPVNVEPAGLHLQVNAYAELLGKSQKQAQLHKLPFARSHGRRLSMGLKEFDALRVILRKHRRTAVAGLHGLPGR